MQALLPASVLGQETEQIFISHPLESDTIIVRLDRREGHGPFRPMVTLLTERGPTALDDPWLPSLESVSGVPDELSEVSIRRFNFQLEQLAYQSYLSGLLSADFYMLWQRVAESDTTKLTREFVDQMTSIAVGMDKEGNTVVIIDTDNDEDLADERPLVFPIADSDSLRRVLAEGDLPTRTVTFEYFDGDSVRTGQAPLAVNPYFAFPGSSPTPAISRKDYRAGTLQVNGQSYHIAASSGFTWGLYRRNNTTILLGPVNLDSIPTERSGNVTLRLGDAVSFSGVSYRVDSITLEGDEIRFAKVLSDSALHGSRVGLAAKDIVATSVDNQEIILSELRGRFVLLVFWGSWCAPCHEEVPFLKDAHEAFGDRMVTVGIALDGLDAIKEFVSKYDLDWPQIQEMWDDHPIVSDYTIQGYPTVLLVDPNGIIVERDKHLRGHDLLQTIALHLGDPDRLEKTFLSGSHMFKVEAANEARVYVTGTFSDWRPLPLYKVGENRWARSLDLNPGSYQYRFLVNGHPLPDPAKETVIEDEGGRVSSLLKVE